MLRPSLDPKEAARRRVERDIRRAASRATWITHASHIAAGALIISSAVASLITLGAAAVGNIAAGHASIEQDASLAIIVLIVLSASVAMLRSAMLIRVERGRGKSAGEMKGHIAILFFVATIEATTYILMLYQYEKPQTWIQWGLVVLRGLAVPALGLYLALAEKVGVTPDDIAIMAAGYTGEGVLLDMAHMAADPARATHEKVAAYIAAAALSPAQEERMKALHEALAPKELPAPAATIVESTAEPLGDDFANDADDAPPAIAPPARVSRRRRHPRRAPIRNAEQLRQWRETRIYELMLDQPRPITALQTALVNEGDANVSKSTIGPMRRAALDRIAAEQRGSILSLVPSPDDDDTAEAVE